MNGQFDLFSVMGFEPEQLEVKKPSKKTEKLPAKKEVKTKEKEVEYVNLPVYVYSGYMDTVVFTKDDFPKDSKVDAKMVLSKLAERFPAFTAALNGISISKTNKSIAVVYQKSVYASSKVTIKADEKTRFLMGNRDLDITSLMTNVTCELSAKDFMDAFEKEHPQFGKVTILYSINDNVVVPYFTSPTMPGEIPFPLSINLFGCEPITITRDDYLNFVNSKSEIVDNEDSNHEEDNTDEEEMSEEDGDQEEQGKAADTVKDVKTANKELLMKIAEDRFPELKGNIRLLYHKPLNSVIVTVVEPQVPTKMSVDKTYPTNATVSIYVHTRILLTPDLFEGAERISEKNLIKFIEERYPEFSPERTYIVYDEKSNIIMPCVKGSSKGSIPCATCDKEEVVLLAKNNLIHRVYDGREVYRVEKNPISLTKASTNGPGNFNRFEYYLPKIPLAMIKVAHELFSYVYNKYGTEAMVQLFWNQEKNQYFWYVPEQIVSNSRVRIIRDEYLERTFFLIADFHSHGQHHAFWSQEDNRDEKGTRVFGVFGSFEHNEVKMLLRAGAGGYFIDLAAEEVIDTTCVNEKYVVEATQRLILDIDKRLTC